MESATVKRMKSPKVPQCPPSMPPSWLDQPFYATADSVRGGVGVCKAVAQK
jgi:hypothetical protein